MKFISALKSRALLSMAALAVAMVMLLTACCDCNNNSGNSSGGSSTNGDSSNSSTTEEPDDNTGDNDDAGDDSDDDSDNTGDDEKTEDSVKVKANNDGLTVLSQTETYKSLFGELENDYGLELLTVKLCEAGIDSDYDNGKEMILTTVGTASDTNDKLLTGLESVINKYEWINDCTFTSIGMTTATITETEDGVTTTKRAIYAVAEYTANS